MLPSGLADRRAHHQLENLVLAEAGLPGCGDVVIGHLGNLVDPNTEVHRASVLNLVTRLQSLEGVLSVSV